MQQDVQIKKITFKFLNQLKLMIKPPQRIIQITSALITLLNGTIASIQGQIKTDWQSIKHFLRNTNEILDIINDQQTFQKRVRFENLEKSIAIKQTIQQSEEPDDTFDTLNETLNQLHAVAKPLFKNLLLCSKSKSRNRSMSHQSLFKKQLQTQQSQQSQLSVCNNSQLSNSKVHRPRSQQEKSYDSRSSSGTREYKKRVQIAQDKKQSRLDKILKLQTNKPQAKSTIKGIIDGSQQLNKSYRSNSKESIIKQEIEKNQQTIKKLKAQENTIKWQIERESKRIMENQVVNQIQDEINRYKIQSQKEQEIKKQRKNSEQQNNYQINKKSSNHNNNNTQLRSNSINTDENKIQNLQQDYMQSQKQRNECENALNKILKTINNSKLKSTK